MRTLVYICVLLPLIVKAQLSDNFSDGNINANPQWLGDTSSFTISNSSAIPPEMKPALQLNSEGSDTSSLYLQNTLISNTEWSFWIKLSFNTSANNFARIYLVSDQPAMKNELNGYFVQIGGTNDSIALCRQQGFDITEIIKGSAAYTGNTTNVLRIKVTRTNLGEWNLYCDPFGGYSFEAEGSVMDTEIINTAYFGIYCKYTSSNATKFYFDDFYVNEIVVDTIPPAITNLMVMSNNKLDVYFSEILEIQSAEYVLHYSVNNGIGNPITAQRDPGDFSLVHLEFPSNFIPGTAYTLSITGIGDLSGNLIENETSTFTYYQSTAINQADIVINEIMADVSPVPANLPEADFLELYNRTGNPLDLLDCSIKPRSSSNPILFPSVIIEPDSFLIVVKTNQVELFEPYGSVIGLADFSLNNEGTIVLRNPQGTLIHSVSYTKDWYHDEQKEEGGWSIEQIDPGHPCNELENWKASLNEYGGTPGTRNSVDGTIYSSPEIIQLLALDDTTLRIFFSHFMDSIALSNSGAYSVDNALGNPSEISIEEGSFTHVSLIFESGFVENTIYKLIITDSIYDCAGDMIPMLSEYSFVLPSKAEPYSIVINEIMADPDPPRGLPEFEYIELYNTTQSFLRMKDWTLKVGSTNKPVPEIVIEPDEYIIFTVLEAVNLFGMVARSYGFSTLGLTNSGTSIKLFDESGSTISQCSYTDDWYEDDEKQEGGWSLEQVDPSNPCSGDENWTASMDDRGGTPGSVNSVNSKNPVNPLIEKIIPLDDNTLMVYFNQLMNTSSILNPLNYTIDRGVGNPAHVFQEGFNLNEIFLELNQSLSYNVLYTLSVSGELLNCVGIPVPTLFSIEFGLPQSPVSNDVVINEVLFNPADDGVDFVEIYNRSDKIIDLKSLKLGSVEVNLLEPNDTAYKSVSYENELMLSNTFKVLTVNPQKVKAQYFTENPDGFIKMESFPSITNEEGTVVLSDQNENPIDVFSYEESMHYPLLNSVEGVSLERINYNRPSQDKTNWHSASKEVGFATPAYRNSQYSEVSDTDDEVIVEPEIFSPDNDGFDDILNVTYKFELPGFTANIIIYDAQGRLVKYLVKNELLGTEGTFSWDGTTDDNRKASIGIYIVLFEAFDMNGNIKKYKKSAVLGGRL
ncbi:MAG: lamin tail domain-containing protein [Bacteroidales bacterium]